MAIATSTILEVRSTATAGNVNGGGFNPNNANMLANLTTTAGTGNTNSPVVSSASYNFTAGDVGAWLYIQGGTNWTPGWYPDRFRGREQGHLVGGRGTSHSVSNNRFQPNTVAGCATVGTPTGGIFTIDYSQQNSAQVSFTNLGSASGSTTLTDNSSGGKFTKVMVGNLICISAGTNAIPGWYEIVSFTNSNHVVLDRSPHAVNTMSATAGKVGGAVSLGGSTTGIADGDFFLLSNSDSSAGTTMFIKGGSSVTYTITYIVSGLATSSNHPPVVEGYASTRGDRPTGATRPTINCGTYYVLFSAGSRVYSLIGTGTGTCVFQIYMQNGAGYSTGAFYYCKVTNTGTTADQAGFLIDGNLFFCEASSYRGEAVQTNNAQQLAIIQGCYIHDSNKGISSEDTLYPATAGMHVSNTIIANCVTGCINIATTYTAYSSSFSNCTLYGAENKLGYGLNVDTDATSPNNILTNCLLYGLTTAIQTDNAANTAQFDDYNNYYNNTTDVNDTTAWQKGQHDLVLNPQFADVQQITGSTATTTAGNHLVQTGATFVSSGVVAGRDCVQIVSGTGVTVGIYGIASVDSETQITTDIALAADATADKVWQITTGRDFSTGAALAGQAYPGVFPGGTTTSYLDIGGVQRQLKDGSFTFGG